MRLIAKETRRPYKPQKCQKIRRLHAPARRQFGESMVRRIRRDPQFLFRLCCTDEATFTQKGSINKQNLRNWAEENPRWIREVDNRRQWKINVWAGIVGDRVVGPHIFEENLNGVMYVDFLQNILPGLLEGNPVQRAQMWWLQDGAPAHNYAPATACLNELFPGRWIGANGPSRWPPYSPDLNPVDWYLWGKVKDLCYREAPTTREDMIQRILNAFATVTPQELTRMRQNYERRLRCVIQRDGGHIEPFL